MSGPDDTQPGRPRWPDPLEHPLLRVSTVHQLGLLPGMGRSAVYEAVRRGDLPSVRVGSRLFIPTAQLLAHLGLSPTPVPASAGDKVGAA